MAPRFTKFGELLPHSDQGLLKDLAGGVVETGIGGRAASEVSGPRDEGNGSLAEPARTCRSCDLSCFTRANRAYPSAPSLCQVGAETKKRSMTVNEKQLAWFAESHRETSRESPKRCPTMGYQAMRRYLDSVGSRWAIRACWLQRLHANG
jgi:hypothetical protein